MIFGKVTIGSNTRTVNGIHRVVCRIQETSGGVVHSLSLYGERSGGGGAKTRAWAVIYADNAGVPGALLAVSSGYYDYGTSPEWHTFIGLSYHTTINNYYWIGYIAADKFIHYYDAGVADQLAQAVDSDTTPDDPFGTPTLSPDEISCYITNIGGTQAVDTDGTGDYTSLSSWESTENGDLVTATVTSTVNCEASSGTADTTAVTVTGWTTSADYDMTIQQAAGDRHSGVWNDSLYRVELSLSGGADGVFFSGVDYFTVDGIQVQVTSSDGNHAFLGTGSVSASNRVIIKNCIIRGVLSTGAVNSYGVFLNNDLISSDCVVQNNLIYDIDVGTGNVAGMLLRGTPKVYNNTINNCDRCIVGSGSPSILAKNNLVRNSGTFCFDSAGDFDVASDFNSADDATATAINATKTAGSPWNSSGDADSDYFLDAGSDDFRPGTGDLHINVGDDLSGTFIYDAVGTNRGSGANTWDLGYFEFVAVGGDVTVNITSEMTATATMYAGTLTADALFNVASEMASTATMYAGTVTADALFSIAAEMASVATMYAGTVTADALFSVAAAMTVLATAYEATVTAESPDVTINIAAAMTSIVTMYNETTTADCNVSVGVMTVGALMNNATVSADALKQLSTMAVTATINVVIVTAEGGEEQGTVVIPLIPTVPTFGVHKLQ